MSVLLGLLAALFYGTTDFLARYVARGTSAYRTMFYGQIAGLVVLSVFLGVSLLGGHSGLPHAPRSAWAWAFRQRLARGMSEVTTMSPGPQRSAIQSSATSAPASTTTRSTRGSLGTAM